MMRSSRLLALPFSVGLVACGPASSADSALNADGGRALLTATVLEGPFASPGGFCKNLALPACEERSDVVTLVGHDPFTTKSGVSISVLTMASRDGSVQRGHVLLNRGSQFYALPPILEYNADDGGRHEASVHIEPAFDDEPADLVKIIHMVWHPQKDGTSAGNRDYYSGVDICSVAARKPIACVRVKTVRAVDNPDAKKGELPAVENVVTMKGLDVSTIVLDHGPPNKEFRSEILADGRYKLVFP